MKLQFDRNLNALTSFKSSLSVKIRNDFMEKTKSKDELLKDTELFFQ